MTLGNNRKHPCSHPGLDLHDPEALRVFDEVCDTALENEGAPLERDAVLAFKAKCWDSVHSRIYGMTDDRWWGRLRSWWEPRSRGNWAKTKELSEGVPIWDSL